MYCIYKKIIDNLTQVYVVLGAEVLKKNAAQGGLL